MDNKKVLIQPTDRVAIVGKTGSGKTYMARYLLKDVDRLIVLDPKGSLGGEDWNLEPFTTNAAKKLVKGGTGRLRVASLPAGPQWNPYLEWADHAGGITVYIDEMYGVVKPGSQPSNELTSLYTRGRERLIGVWASTQRPTWVPLFALSEAEWLLVFRLNLQEDRDRMAAFGGVQMKGELPSKYAFWLYNTAWREPYYSPGLRKGGVI